MSKLDDLLKGALEGQVVVGTVEEAALELSKLRAENDRMEEQIDRMETGLQEINNWTKAYPLEMFPEPDFKKARKLLEAGGITLDSVSASSMRHVIKGVEKLVHDALGVNP